MNPFEEIQARMEALKADFSRRAADAAAGVAAAVKGRVDAIFGDINAEETPVAHGIRQCGDATYDLLDGVVHAIAELEKRLPGKNDKAA